METAARRHRGYGGAERRPKARRVYEWPPIRPSYGDHSQRRGKRGPAAYRKGRHQYAPNVGELP